jgi:probable addiction module antidote protein
MALKTTPFDVARVLEREEDIREYFAQVIEDGDADEILRALSHIARARGILGIKLRPQLRNA